MNEQKAQSLMHQHLGADDRVASTLNPRAAAPEGYATEIFTQQEPERPVRGPSHKNSN